MDVGEKSLRGPLFLNPTAPHLQVLNVFACSSFETNVHPTASTINHMNQKVHKLTKTHILSISEGQ